MSTTSLVEKYEQLLTLRREREDLEANGIYALEGEADTRRKARCRALAASFPGALRELDHLDAEAMARRLERARLAMHNDRAGAEVARFEVFVSRFHELGRMLGSLRRWQSGFRAERGRRPRVADALHAFKNTELLAVLGKKDLALWLAPPAGRGQELLWQKLSQEFDRPSSVLKDAWLNSGDEERF